MGGEFGYEGYQDSDFGAGMVVYAAPDQARVSENSRRLTPIPSPEFNDNPRIDVPYTELADNIRDLDFDPGRTRRGYIAWFLNPAQWTLGSDYFVNGKVQTGKQSATAWDNGMRPDQAQRANIQNPSVTSYGDLVTMTTDMLGIEPYSGG